MYYYISGTLAALSPSIAVIDAGGVGYKLSISSNTLSKLSGKDGANVKLYSYFSVREDAMELFGFFDEEEKAAFELLISVSGVGPKAALAVLSVLIPEKLTSAVTSGDVKQICKANGVGKKIAERIVLELKDKVVKVLGAPQTTGRSDEFDGASESDGSAVADAQAALIVLGYSRSEANYALASLDPSLDAETLIREGLKRLMKG